MCVYVCMKLFNFHLWPIVPISQNSPACLWFWRAEVECDAQKKTTDKSLIFLKMPLSTATLKSTPLEMEYEL